jgi:hypothetical protein
MTSGILAHSSGLSYYTRRENTVRIKDNEEKGMVVYQKHVGRYATIIAALGER